MIRRIVPELMVEDVESTVSWYKEILGFVDVEHDVGFARLKAGEAELMLFERSEFAREIPEFGRKETGGTQVLYLEMVGLAERYGMIKEKVEVIKELWQTPYKSRETIIRDPNGYYLLLGERG